MNTHKHTWIIILGIILVAVVIVTMALQSPDQNVISSETLTEEVDYSDNENESAFNIPENVFDVFVSGQGLLVNPQESNLTWTGRRQIIRSYEDSGSINLAQGRLDIDGGRLLGGAFLVDMTSITVNRTGRGDGNSQLARHLSSADFFDVIEYPYASLYITHVAGDISDMEITGDMTIKGITQEITFPAQMTEEGDEYMTFEGLLTIDRSSFDVRFGSPSFFNNLGDNAIDDEFTLEVMLHVMLDEEVSEGEGE